MNLNKALVLLCFFVDFQCHGVSRRSLPPLGIFRPTIRISSAALRVMAPAATTPVIRQTLYQSHPILARAGSSGGGRLQRTMLMVNMALSIVSKGQVKPRELQSKTVGRTAASSASFILNTTISALRWLEEIPLTPRTVALCLMKSKHVLWAHAAR